MNQDRVVMITGATKNTGYAIAEKFAKEKYSVIITSRFEEKAVEAANSIKNKYGVEAAGYALDLSDIKDIKSVFKRIESAFGRLDIFVANSANLGVNIDILSCEPESFDDVMNVNLRGTYFCCQQAAKLMVKQLSGSIVVIGSVHYQKSIWGRSLYAVSKGALASLVRSMAFELGCYGVRANYIVAGAIKTDRWDAYTEKQIAEKRKNWPIGKEATGEDIANAAFYLGTDLSGAVTGTDLTVDSGIGICLLPNRDRPIIEKEQK